MQRQDFWSKFHRFFGFSYDHFGFCFNYHGDEIVWIKPSKRHVKGYKFLSIGFGVTFKTLKDIDDEWKMYWDAFGNFS